MASPVQAFDTTPGVQPGAETSQQDSEESDPTPDRSAWPGWDEYSALELFFSPDTIPYERYSSDLLRANLLSSSTSDGALSTIPTFVQFLQGTASSESEMYPQYCPTIIVYAWDNDEKLNVVDSYDLECYSNYDDSSVSLRLDLMTIGSTEVITLTATGSGANSEMSSSETHLFLYGIVDGRLTELVQIKIDEDKSSTEDESDNYSRSWAIEVSKETTNGLPDLICKLTHSSVEGEVEGAIDTYHWTSGKFQ